MRETNHTTPYRSGEAENSADFSVGTFVARATDGFLKTAGAGDTLLGVSATENVFAADNETVAQKKVTYKNVDGDLGERMLCKLANGTSLVFDADLVASNTINLKVNGTAMTEVAFDSDNATTLAAIATQLEADFPTLIDDATAVAADDTVLITPADGVTITLTDIVVAAGASQANGSQVDNFDKADEGDYYDITSAQKVDGSTNSASSGQLKLEKYISQTLSEFSIANT